MQRLINPFVVGYALIYVINFLFAFRMEGFPLEESLGIFVVVGVGFSSIALLVSRKAVPLVAEKPGHSNELLVLTGLTLFLTLSIIAGNRPLEFLIPGSLQDEASERSVIGVVRKVITFVVIPFFVYRRLYSFQWTDFGLSTEWRKVFTSKSILIFIVMSAIVLLLNYFGGSAAKPIRDGQFIGQQLLIGIPLLFAWDLVEVGLVEEFYFRGLLQNRLAVLLRSPWGAVYVSALIFGLVHAPGMYLRGAGVIEGLGANPSAWMCMSYCIAVQSVPAIFFGIIWQKTRNLWLLMGIHAMMDLLPHLAEFITEWNL